MTDTTQDAPLSPVLLARGRYAVTEMPDGGLVITRTGQICAVCEVCGCGEQLDPIAVPAMLAALIRRTQEGQRPSVAQVRKLTRMAFGALMGGGGPDEDLEGGGTSEH